MQDVTRVSYTHNLRLRLLGRRRQDPVLAVLSGGFPRAESERIRRRGVGERPVSI